MFPDGLICCALVGLSFSTFALAELSPAQLASLPPPASVRVDFKRDVQPLLEARCIQCHGRGKTSGGFNLEKRSTALAGGRSGPAILPGRSAESYLIELVSGLDPDNVMPAKGTRLTVEEVGRLRAWIDQGLEWDEGTGFGRLPARNLKPHRPELPDGGGLAVHPIDCWMVAYFESEGVEVPGVVDDAAYARRVYLDVVGLIPTPAQLETFVRDPSEDKRLKLVRQLLEDRDGYAVHWLTFWNDALRNDYQGTGYIDGGRRQITGWLYGALAGNLSYDQFVRELVNPSPAAAGFINGIVWRGVVNASQTPEMQAAQNLSQVFMGVNLKCASCHDSFINDWTLADAYGLAGVYAAEPLEMVHCDKPTGQVAPLRFLYPELGDIDPRSPRDERVRQLAELMTAERNGRLSRTIVNRLWARLLGRGLVEPVDDMEQPAWYPDLLDWLASDLVAHRYDLKRTLELILTSQAYQLPAIPAPERATTGFVFRGPLIRRLTAEQFLDAISQVAGVWNAWPSARLGSDAQPDQAGSSAARWVWHSPEALTGVPPQTVRWRRTFELQTIPDAAVLLVTCDNEFTCFVNGRQVATGNEFKRPESVNLGDALRTGRNVIAIEAVNVPARPDESAADQSSPAGLLAHVFLRFERSAPPQTETQSAAELVEFGTDRSWRWSVAADEGWNGLEFDDAAWQPGVELGPPGNTPWNLGEEWHAARWTAQWAGRARAALMVNDPLMTALGRPNREQVVTSRSTVATTLQALEMTNGETLANWLRRGAERLLREPPASGIDLVKDLYRRALGRQPTDAELGLAAELVGPEPGREEVEDLLWAMIMLPEFQLIH